MEKFSSVDEVLDFAIGREVEARDLYLKLADMVEKPEMARVLSDLAAEELEHKEKLEAVKAGEAVMDDEEVGNLGITDYLSNVEPKANMSYVDLLIVGMKKEEKARKLYADLASASQDQTIREIFLKLVRQEADHKLRFEIEYDLLTF